MSQFNSLGRETFDSVVAILSANPIFISSGRKPQRHVKYQLGAFLFRYGRLGTDSLEVAAKLGIGHGTVIKYCKRVSRALRQLRPQYLCWPNNSKKDAISSRIEARSGFPGCVSCCDGSLIRFCEEPEEHGDVFMSRKKYYAVSGASMFYVMRIANSRLDKYPDNRRRHRPFHFLRGLLARISTRCPRFQELGCLDASAEVFSSWRIYYGGQR